MIFLTMVVLPAPSSPRMSTRISRSSSRNFRIIDKSPIFDFLRKENLWIEGRNFKWKMLFQCFGSIQRWWQRFCKGTWIARQWVLCAWFLRRRLRSFSRWLCWWKRRQWWNRLFWEYKCFCVGGRCGWWFCIWSLHCQWSAVCLELLENWMLSGKCFIYHEPETIIP